MVFQGSGGLTRSKISKMSIKFESSLESPASCASRGLKIASRSPQYGLPEPTWTQVGRMLALGCRSWRALEPSKNHLIFCFFFSRKKRENHRFWLPKTFPKSFRNVFKIDVPQEMQNFVDVLRFLVVFCFACFFFEVFTT